MSLPCEPCPEKTLLVFWEADLVDIPIEITGWPGPPLNAPTSGYKYIFQIMVGRPSGGGWSYLGEYPPEPEQKIFATGPNELTIRGANFSSAGAEFNEDGIYCLRLRIAYYNITEDEEVPPSLIVPLMECIQRKSECETCGEPC